MRHLTVPSHLLGAARRALSGTLTAAVLLSGLVFAPAPAQAASASNDPNYEHYKFTASTSHLSDHDKLPSNLQWGSNVTEGWAVNYRSGDIYYPDGAVSTKSFMLVSNAKTRDSGSVTEAGDHYGLPYRLYYSADGENAYTAIDENLKFEVAAMDSLDTDGVAAVNVALICPQSVASNVDNVALNKRLRVFVMLDGDDDYLPDSVGVRSSKLIAGGMIQTTTSGSKSQTQGVFYRIETENLLDIEGVEPGDTIKRIMIMPHGEYARSYGNFYLSALYVNAYPTLAEFDDAAPADEIATTNVGGATLRQIALNEALRTAQISWKTNIRFKTYDSFNYTYFTSSTYYGPVYERQTDSTRELFQSLLADGKYTEDEMLASNGSLTHPYGMDCQTFVFNAVSRVSRTNAWAVENTLGAAHVSLLGDLTTVPHAAYTDRDIIEVNDPQAIYENYAAAQAGDIALHYLPEESSNVHTRLVRSVTVKRNADGTINPDKSYMYCTEQAGGIEYNTTSTVGSSSRQNADYSFTALLNSGYVAFTLDEYQTGLVENVNVEAVAGSKTAGTHFTQGGLNLAMSSNYRIISYRVTLEDLTNDETLWESDLALTKGVNVRTLNYQNTDLDAILAELPNGSYRINAIVDSGPFTTLEQDTVPQTVVPINFYVNDGSICPPNGHSSASDWTPLTAAWISSSCTIEDDSYYKLPAGKYYLDGDVTVPNNYNLKIAGTTTLCLNGNTLSVSGTKTNNCIYIGSGVHLSLCDCGETGIVQVGDINTKEAAYAFYLTSTGQLDMYGGTITNSYGNYGVIYLNGTKTDTSKGSVMNMYGGSITGNQSAYCGGVFGQYGSQFNMYGGSISGNTGSTMCSGVYVKETSTVNLLGGTISGNSGGTAGAVYLNSKSTLTTDGVTISGNSGSNASAVFVSANSSFTMKSGTITENVDGPAPVRIGSSTASFTMYDGAQIINNKGTVSGAVLLSATGSFTMEGGTISGNSVENADTSTFIPAGAVSVRSGATFTMKGGEIIANTSPLNGGGVSNLGTTLVSGGRIYDNTVTGEGGGGVYNEGTLTLTGGAISKNTDSADASGGGVYNKGTFTMSGGSIAENTTAAADTDGGAGVYNAATGTFEMTGGTITKNSSGASGGGVYNANSFTMSDNAKITENTATTSGGGIYNVGDSENEVYATATINAGTLISKNTSTSYGGGISNAGILHVYGEVSENSGSSGGGIRTGYEAHIYDGALIKGNKAATYYGGGISNFKNLYIEGGSVTENEAKTHGGGVYNEGTLTMSGGDITSNTATKNGGGVHSIGTFTMSGGSIYGNTRGGSIGKDVSVYNGTFTMTDGLIGDSGSATAGRLWVYSDKNKTSSATINGGTLLGPNGASGAGNSSLTVNGGKVEMISTTGTTTNVDINLNGGFFTRMYEDTADKTAGVVYTIGEGVFFRTTGDETWPYELAADQLYASNMVLGKTLDMNVYFKQDLLSAQPASAMVYVGEKDGVAAEVTTTELDGTGVYCVAVPGGVAAKEMSDEIRIVLLDAEDEYIISTVESVKGYAERILNDPEQADAHQLMTDMLAFGAAAQQYFEYNTENPADSELTALGMTASDPDGAIAAAKEVIGDDINYARSRAYHSANLTLENDVDFNLYFWIGQLESTDYTITVNGDTKPGVFAECLDQTAPDGQPLLYKVKVDGLTYADLAGSEVSVTFTQKGEHYTTTITDSPVNYLVRNDGKSRTEWEGADDSHLYGSVMAFINSANRYNAN